MHPLVSLAKQAVEQYIKKGEVISPAKGLPAEFLKKKAGVFVTIMEKKELRGCIGTFLSTRENIAQEVINNAIAAAVEDYRFGQVQAEELPFLSFEVSILSVPEFVKDIKKLNPKKDGIIVKSQGFNSGSDAIFNPASKPFQKTGLLLPDLDGVDTVEQQIDICCQKAGINPGEKDLDFSF